MNKKWWIIFFITIAVVILMPMKGKLLSRTGLIGSNLSNKQAEAVPQTPVPSPTPKTFKFDSSTDLKKELDSVIPQVLESDFE